MTDNDAKMNLFKPYEEGNDLRTVVSSSEGGRALRLLKKREEAAKRSQQLRKEIDDETRKRRRFTNIEKGFSASSADVYEEEFKNATIGLVSMEEFKMKRKMVDELIEESQKNKEQEGKKWHANRKKESNKLSFNDELEDEEDEEIEVPKKHIHKDPTANTSFLSDTLREQELRRKRQELIEQYEKDQEEAKKSKLEITYSYWDGSGHRRSIVVQRGYTIGQFLLKSKIELEKTDFPELRTVAVDNLMYVKEDLIIPHNTTFHELIQNKARGKSGPLFSFDVHEDIRQYNDSRVEKDESHAGKIVDRKWYERNKHIFPASRWEMYNKEKTYEQYTVKGATDVHEKKS